MRHNIFDSMPSNVVSDKKEDVFKKMDAIANAVSDSCEPAIIPDITLQTVDGKTVFEGNNRYYDQALCAGLNITDEDIDDLCKAMKEQAVPKRSFLLYGQKRPNMV